MRVGICVREYNKKGTYSCFDKCIGVPKPFIDIFQNFNVTPVLLTMGSGLRELTETIDNHPVPIQRYGMIIYTSPYLPLK